MWGYIIAAEVGFAYGIIIGYVWADRNWTKWMKKKYWK